MALLPRTVLRSAVPSRRGRSPQHPFNVKAPPFCIAPFFIAPVLAGETMKNLLMQARVVTDPIKNRLIGWHVEYYFFYVKLRDLALRDDLTQMLLDPNKDVTGFDAPTAVQRQYHPAGVGMINYVEMCEKRVVEEFFRDEADGADDYTVTDAGSQVWRTCQINQNNPFDSAFAAAAEVAQDPTITVGVDDKIGASEIDFVMRQWELLRQHNLTQMSYEDYLGTFGVRPKAEELHRPELVRYLKEWSYPTNTVDPLTGIPTSAVSWSIAERADKDRFFREPGFLCGYTVTRPKVYIRNQTGTFTAGMNSVLSWLPALMQSDPQARRKLFGDNIGPFQAGSDTAGYWVDMGDLFTYGEQFVNHSLAGTAANMLPIPAANLANKRYPTTFSWIQELFAGTTPVSMVEQDGIVSLTILGTLKDESPRGGANLAPAQ